MERNGEVIKQKDNLDRSSSIMNTKEIEKEKKQKEVYSIDLTS